MRKCVLWPNFPYEEPIGCEYLPGSMRTNLQTNTLPSVRSFRCLVLPLMFAVVCCHQIEIDVSAQDLVSLSCDPEPMHAEFIPVTVSSGTKSNDALKSASTTTSAQRTYTHIGRLLIASFDIECIGQEGSFPDANNPKDEVAMRLLTLFTTVVDAVLLIR